MAYSLVTADQCFVKKSKEEEEAVEKTYANYGKMIKSLPSEKSWLNNDDYFVKYQDFWFNALYTLPGIMYAQDHFKARPSDIFLVTPPKCGTTWFKGLIFAIVNRTKYDFTPDHPLLNNNPHDCVPYLEIKLYTQPPIGNPEVLRSPRLLSSHVPYSILPESIKTSGCKIVSVFRNPKDVFVSLWHFILKVGEKDLSGSKPVSKEEAFDMYCRGISMCGPIWEHALGFWKASLESPNAVLFMKYEEMRNKPFEGVKKLAVFLGYPFSEEEEESGVVQQILDLCSFEKMKSLQVNKTGRFRGCITNDVFFREGRVGDWKNHFTEEMIERIDKITEEKFAGTGLSL